MKYWFKVLIYTCLVVLLFAFSIGKVNSKYKKTYLQTSAELRLSNQKIEWGIKREDNHKQPDLGKKNKELIEKYNGLAIGNSEDKYVYLTFDLGYEAVYTEKILDTLKENSVPATFFITGHYVNTASDLVQRMIDEGHIIGNQSPHTLMEL